MKWRTIHGRRMGLMVAVLLSAPMVFLTARGEDASEGSGFEEVIEYIRVALETYPIVCLAEGGHQAEEPHRLLRSVLSDGTILASVDVVIVEFASSGHQAALDAFIRGEDVPFSTVSRIWRDTGQSPHAPWDSPLYYELLRVIRSGNLLVPPEKRVRVLAGDPPIDWESIRTREAFRNAYIPRDPFVAELAMEQAFELQKRVLLIFGGAHLPKVPIGPGDPRNSLTHYILERHPGSVAVIGFLDPEALGVEDRIHELVWGSVYPTASHWSGNIDADRLFNEIYSLVADPQTGQQSWRQIPLYRGYSVRDLFDALIYLGPVSEWKYAPAFFDEERDAEYRKELERRSLVRFGRPLKSGLD